MTPRLLALVALAATCGLGVPRAGAQTTTTTLPPGVGITSAYGFEEASGTVLFDATLNANDGALDQATRAAGKYGRGLDTRSGRASAPAIAAPYTISMALLPADTTGTQLASSSVAATSTSPYWYLGSVGAEWVAGFFTGTGYEEARGGSAVVGHWSDVAFTIHPGTKVLTLYVDSQARGTKTLSRLPAPVSRTLFGKGPGTKGLPWRGRFDEFRSYARPLSGPELAADAAQPVAPSSTTTTSSSSSTSTSSTTSTTLTPALVETSGALVVVLPAGEARLPSGTVVCLKIERPGQAARCPRPGCAPCYSIVEDRRP